MNTRRAPGKTWNLLAVSDAESAGRLDSLEDNEPQLSTPQGQI